MTKYKIDRLDLKWTISKARDTYGYNRLTLTDKSGKRYWCVGGGYDMQGTVFADYLMHNYRDRIIALVNPFDNAEPYYGLNSSNGKTWLDGACGLSSMIEIAKAISLELEQIYRNNRLQGFIVAEQIKEELA